MQIQATASGGGGSSTTTVRLNYVSYSFYVTPNTPKTPKLPIGGTRRVRTSESKWRTFLTRNISGATPRLTKLRSVTALLDMLVDTDGCVSAIP